MRPGRRDGIVLLIRAEQSSRTSGKWRSVSLHRGHKIPGTQTPIPERPMAYPVLRLRGWVGRSPGRGRFVDRPMS